MQTVWSESSICSVSHSRTLDRVLLELRFPGPPAFLLLRGAEHLPLSPAGLQLCSAKQGGSLIRPFPLQPWDPPPSITSLTPPSRRNPRWVRSDKESPAVQTVGGNRRGVVGGTHQHIYFIEIKIYAHKQTTEYPERSQGGGLGGGGGGQLSEIEYFTIRPWMERVETPDWRQRFWLVSVSNTTDLF